MEPISAAASILGVIGAIASVTSAATAFMRDFKSARKEIVALKKELAALKAILEILADDLHDSASTRASYPDGVVERIVELAANCNRVVNEIGECVRVQGQGPATRLTWATTGRANVERLRGELEAHKSTLSVTLDLVSVIVLRDIKNDTDQIRQDTSTLLQGTGQIQSDVNRILVEISRLQVQLSTVQENGHYQSNYVLERFLGDLKSDTETVLGAPEDLTEWSTDSAMSGQPWSESFVYSHRRSDYLNEATTSDTQQAPQVRLNEPFQMEHDPASPSPDAHRPSSPGQVGFESAHFAPERDPEMNSNDAWSLSSPRAQVERTSPLFQYAAQDQVVYRPIQPPGPGPQKLPASQRPPPEVHVYSGARSTSPGWGSESPPVPEHPLGEDPAPVTFVDFRTSQRLVVPYESCKEYEYIFPALSRCFKDVEAPAHISQGLCDLVVPGGDVIISAATWDQHLNPGSVFHLRTWVTA